MTSETNPEKHALLFDIRRSVRYHSRRRQFFDRYRLLTSAFSAIFGSAAIAAVLAELPKEFAVSAAALVTVLSVIDLVVGSARMARLHEDLYRRFISLEKEAIGIDDADFSHEDFKRLTARRLEIEADEPPIKRVLDTICYNELLRAMGYEDKDYIPISRRQRFFAQFFDVEPHKLSKPS